MAKPSDRSPERKLQVVLSVLRGVWLWACVWCSRSGSGLWAFMTVPNPGSEGVSVGL